MTWFLQSFVAALTLLSAACGRQQPPAAGNPDAARAVQTGVASFYSSESAGRKTASGEKLKLDKMTAASRTLPLGTRVKVTNVQTGQSANVRINDRGPYAKGRVLDLTPKAAQHVGVDRKDGVARVSIRPIPAHEPSRPDP